MARSTPVKKAWRSLAWLGVITVGLTALLAGGVLFSTATWAPKLALDLEGGTQIILAPRLESGQTVTQEQLDQAVSIIRDRIDAAGVAEAEVTTQGGQNVVVSIPGEPDAQTLARIQSSAKLEFRPVIYTDVATSSSVDSTSSPTPEPTDSSSPTPEPLATTATAAPTDASDPNWVSPALYDEYLNFDCSTLEDTNANVAPADEPLITCEQDGSFKYILGPVEVSGETISDATSGLVPNSQGVSTGVWGVFITFNGEGTEQFAQVTERLYGFPDTDPRNRFAIVLDGAVISAPTTNAIITDGKPVISGNFTQETAKVLADQLKFGALPIGFEVQSNETISATLGTTQLQSGIIAGLIGLILVVIYSLFQYRLLGTVTIASLVVAAVLTYLVIAILSWRQGYRLSLAGVAGLIVAIGLTVDSFIVYFERIRDELRDGRALEGAVEAGWKRALRTIYSSKTINLLSAIILFFLAVGNVRGFALTLGITVVIDVIVVVLFTHPMLQLLAATKFFSSGHPASGLDPNALGAVYRGRAQFREPVVAPKSGASREAAKRQTIAERKAAELDAASTRTKGKDS
ncbi:protein translocase subunit SecD [Salinibacterium soli]|uniref:Protein translocase subunit SecD n=1 Tax=Antiquaquibacter soli TaxID=3064523 RepID=A0ABT9BLZ8_9MICO|nr:protein translocase subunit SecD [Protaetiibacter sp. WY-16]MDO7882047.1 protein translocase subunit SecD [Protaetiibacter sp. WY-16]